MDATNKYLKIGCDGRRKRDLSGEAFHEKIACVYRSEHEKLEKRTKRYELRVVAMGRFPNARVTERHEFFIIGRDAPTRRCAE